MSSHGWKLGLCPQAQALSSRFCRSDSVCLSLLVAFFTAGKLGRNSIILICKWKGSYACRIFGFQKFWWWKFKNWQLGTKWWWYSGQSMSYELHKKQMTVFITQYDTLRRRHQTEGLALTGMTKRHSLVPHKALYLEAKEKPDLKPICLVTGWHWMTSLCVSFFP